MSDPVALIRRWLERRGTRLPRREDLGGGAHSLASWLRDAGETELAEAFDHRGAPVMGRPSSDAELALAQALGAFVAGNPDCRRLETADQLLSYARDCCDAFREAAVAGLRVDPSQTDALEARLLQTATNLPTRDSGMVAALASRHATRNSPRDLWLSHPFSAQAELRQMDGHDLLCRVRPDAWLALAERLPAPEAAAWLVADANIQNVNALNFLIARAAPAFAPDEAWNAGARAIYPLLGIAEQQLQRSAGLGPMPEPASLQTFLSELTAILGHLERRPDFPWIGFAWLQDLLWQERSTRLWGVRDGLGLEDAITRITEALAGRLGAHPHPLGWIAAEEPLWRSCRASAVLMPLILSDQGAIGQVLDALVLDDLLSTTALADALMASDTATSRIFGTALLSLPDPASWLRDRWNDSFATRDRLFHWQGVWAADGKHPGAIIVAFGCAALAQLRHAPQRTVSASGLWRALCDIVCEARITRGGAPGKIWEVAARWLALTAGDFLADLPEASRTNTLRGFLLRHREFATEFLELIRQLRKGGMPLTAVDAALAPHRTVEFAERLLARTRRQPPRSRFEREHHERIERISALILEPDAPGQ